ncbi:MAG TPA: glycosyltransferase family 2 protein [Methylibium sp.]
MDRANFHQAAAEAALVGIRECAASPLLFDGRPALAIVVPCFNEEEVLPETARCLAALMESLIAGGEISAASGIYFIDDGSTDRTWARIEALAAQTTLFHGVKLAHNSGHQNAVLVGLFQVSGDALVTIDADLQDDPEAIREMLAAFRGGAEVVYGVRRRRDSDSFFKRVTAEGYYRLLGALGVEVVFNHADYRLMSRCAVDALQRYGECNLFLRGIVPKLGFSHATVYYDRGERLAGESKYPLGKMLALAVQGVTSFSAAPLRAITMLGFVVSLLSFLGALWVVWVRLMGTHVVPGWASIVVPVFFLGGIQLLSLGVIGEYIAKIYMETKRRPRYLVDRNI